MKRSVTVRVPATTSNLGPGFDCLGLALELYNEATLVVHEGTGETTIEIEGEGQDTLSRGSDNAVARGIRTMLAGRNVGRLELKCLNRIPLARGLGSSAAAAVAGLAAANRLLETPVADDQLIDYAATMEGHPDNAAPAVLGGLVASVKDGDAWRSFPLKAHPDLRAVVCVPDFELATSKARAVLPHTYLREDALHSASRAALLSSALQRGLWDALPLAMEDRFHQPYRAPLIKGMAAVIRAAREAGCGAALSGAGPTMLALGPAGPGLDRAAKAMEQAFAKAGVGAKAMVLRVAKGVEVSG